MKKLVSISFIVLVAVALLAQNTTVLVTGNRAYKNDFSVLANPAPEARQMATILESIGFEVIRAYNVQVDGQNYLLPTGIDIPDERRTRSRGVSVSEVTVAINASGPDTSVITLDASRTNSFDRGNEHGIAKISPSHNSLVVFATDAGESAKDGPFTSTLLKQITTPGWDMNRVLKHTRADVLSASKGKQSPDEYSQLITDTYLAGRSGTVSSPEAPSIDINVEMPKAPEGYVFIEGGRFTMGSPLSESEREDDEGPQHQVTVSDFYMSKYEVTQREWSEMMGSNPSHFKGDDLPVEKVSWFDAVKYCNALNKKAGLETIYHISGGRITANFGVSGYRLPTEAEWEYAARGGKKSQGYPYAGGNSPGEVGWYGDNSVGKTHSVGGKVANELGLYDMSGNVWEWCWDWYGNYPKRSQRDPRGSSGGSFRVRRGGSWYNYGYRLRSAGRSIFSPSYRSFILGIRLIWRT